MREFFRSWRRKFGLLTLVMACIFMAGWIRSRYVQDTFTVPVGFNSYIQIAFLSQHMLVGAVTLTDTGGGSSDGIRFWMSQDRNVNEWLVYEFQGNSASLESSDGFGTDRASSGFLTKRLQYSMAKCPTWAIVSPLTAISAFLLLTKPRKSTQKKAIDSISAEGI